MAEGDFNNARKLVEQAFSIGNTPRVQWLNRLCVPEGFKGAALRTLVVVALLWISVVFYHGWNEGSFMYDDAGTAINIDCARSVESSLAQEMCKSAKLHRGVHPLVHAAEYTLLGIYTACVNAFLAVMGSSLLMMALFAFAAFCAALWYISPSRRGHMDHCHMPSIWDGRSALLQHPKGIDHILAGNRTKAE